MQDRSGLCTPLQSNNNYCYIYILISTIDNINNDNIRWGRLGPNLHHRHQWPWNQRHLNPWVEGNIFIPFHSFVTSASDIPSKLELHLFDIHQATWGKTEAIRCPKTRSGLQICWGYQPHPWTHNSTGCSHKDNTSHNSHVQFYELWRFYFSDRQTNKECAQHQPVNQLTGQPVKQQQPFKQVGTVTFIFWACWILLVFK